MRDTTSKHRIRTERLLDLYWLNINLVQIIWTRSVNRLLNIIVQGKIDLAIQRAKQLN